MQLRNTHRALATLFFLGGVWACGVSNLIVELSSIGFDQGLGPIAAILALTMCAAGVVWFFRPVLGMALAAATLIPQAFSFAGGSIAYALNFWPNYRMELMVPGAGNKLLSFSTHPFSLSPSWRLTTDGNYLGFGIGIEVVCFMILVALAVALVVSRHTGNAPNQSFKPTPSARLN